MQGSTDDVYEEFGEEFEEEEEEEIEEEYEEEVYGDDEWYWDEYPSNYDDDYFEDEYWVRPNTFSRALMNRLLGMFQCTVNFALITRM